MINSWDSNNFNYSLQIIFMLSPLNYRHDRNMLLIGKQVHIMKMNFLTMFCRPHHVICNLNKIDVYRYQSNTIEHYLIRIPINLCLRVRNIACDLAHAILKSFSTNVADSGIDERQCQHCKRFGSYFIHILYLM